MKTLTWSVALLLSAVYFLLFLRVSEGKLDSGLLFGFCVWGEPTMPDDSEGCMQSENNSHLLSFYVDAALTAAVALFWYLDPQRGDFMKVDIMYLSNGFIILIHGLLHWWLQQTTFDSLNIINCYSKIGADLEQKGYIIFGTFSFALSLVILCIGFGLKFSTLVGSGLFAATVIHLIKDIGGDLFLPGLFCVVHPLSCFTGLFSDAPELNGKVGTLFAISSVVGILELSSCESILRPWGGHVWYDIALHSAVVASTPYFTSSSVAIGGRGKKQKRS